MTNKDLQTFKSWETNDYDPFNIDISEFKALSKRMPKDGNVSLEVASQLAAEYLKAADRCSEIHCALLWKTKKAKQDANTTRQRLYLMASEKGFKTGKDRAAYAESHDDYIEADDKFIQAEAVKKRFEDMHSWFLKNHQYMKEKLKSEQSHRDSSGFSETIGNSYGEKTNGESSW